jgi:hypothetical protein
MKVRPLLYKPAMIIAQLQNRKRMTRRMPDKDAIEALDWCGGGRNKSPGNSDDILLRWGAATNEDTGKKSKPQWLVFSAEYPEEGCIPIGEAYGNIGDLLWAKETHSFVPDSDEPVGVSQVLYAADGERCGKLRPSIFMHRWASRLTNLLTNVRIERLHEITEEDAIAEGVEFDSGWEAQLGEGHSTGRGWRNYLARDEEYSCPTAIASYRTLWDSINGVGHFDTNPWVWVLTFDVIKQNVDAYIKAAA